MKPKLKISPDGTREWYLNGKLHREDGPAFERPDGSRHWYLNDKEVDFSETSDPKIKKLLEYKKIYDVVNG